MDYCKIGQQIRRIRKACGLSQEELAEKADISTTHMSHIETGSTKLSLPVLVAIAAALDTRVDDILHPGSSAKTAAADEISLLLQSCTPEQTQVLADVMKAAKRSMDRYL